MKTRQMCDKAILKNCGTLKPVIDCYKNSKISNKAVDNYPQVLELVAECYKTQKMYEKPVDTHPPTIKYVSECYKTQGMRNKAVYRSFFVFNSFPDQYKTPEIYDIIVSLYPL